MMCFAIWVAAATQAFAFPEMARHGYPNCSTCHLSPAGGGVLTEYGRELSREALSTWGGENESKALYGFLKTPEWLLVGGDFRGVYVIRDTPSATEGRRIPMQADLEAALSFSKWAVSATAGLAGGRTVTLPNRPISRRHYALVRATDELALRAGRFQAAYGLAIPEHESATRKGIGFDQERETYNLEASWSGEKLSGFLTGIAGRPDQPSLGRERGLAAQAIANLGTRYRLGGSYYFGSGASGGRQLLGPLAILGLSPRAFVLAELALSRSTAWGSAAYIKVDYEPILGWHAYAFTEHLRRDFSLSTTGTFDYGVGTQWYPRPHWNLAFSYMRYRTAAFPVDQQAAVWLFHFYL